MASWVGKKYKLDKSENFDDYMKALGVGMVLRTIGNKANATVDLVKEDDGSYTLTTSSTFKTTVIKFKPNEEFDEETIDGRKVKSICTFENENKLVHEQKGEKPTTIIREFNGDEMVATLTIGDVNCVRTYKAA